jgi:ParB-like chromosome segregation protein Spo0J
MGPFDWSKYAPIIVEKIGDRLIIHDGMTRVEAARRAGITELPAFVFKDK